MAVDSIIQIISQVGFPIAVCLVCFYYIKTKDDSHKAEIDKLGEAINNNTIVMQKLIDKLS